MSHRFLAAHFSSISRPAMSLPTLIYKPYQFKCNIFLDWQIIATSTFQNVFIAHISQYFLQDLPKIASEFLQILLKFFLLAAQFTRSSQFLKSYSKVSSNLFTIFFQNQFIFFLQLLLKVISKYDRNFHVICIKIF